MEMKSRPREHAREEGFKSISSDASSICHKTSSKFFLVVDILHPVYCFKICFNYVLPLPMERSVNWSNKHVFVRRNCKELWGNLRRWYLVNGHGDLFFLFYISKHCTIDNNLWKFDKNRMLILFWGNDLNCSAFIENLSSSEGVRANHAKKWCAQRMRNAIEGNHLKGFKSGKYADDYNLKLTFK